ncbi:Crp/Fnr family transcriptional regulator [Desmospora profundinema]|uniref:CRP-like cAMP-binding protein n=1 Tax=Desmospora profundinema TaxID=1571184 RepID=A0ABU1IMY7_9BACL|nr:Crp/Fnr family transcriptional regulator [Desmospora profundinema]MDR6226137.1 CRP-like cAMP-binding protein [Desmospora profundinema]
MRLHRGEILFRQGESGNLYRLEKGLIKVVRLQSDGSSLLFNLLVPGEFFPHHSLLSPHPYFATAIAVIPSEVTVVPADSWYQELEKNPHQYRQVALHLQTTLRSIQERMDWTTAPSSQRLTLLRQWFQHRFPAEPLEERLTQEEIGQLLGLTRETVNRLMRKSKEK